MAARGELSLLSALDAAVAAARAAGDVLRRGFGTRLEGTLTKTHRHDPVTIYDRDADRIIAEILLARRPARRDPVGGGTHPGERRRDVGRRPARRDEQLPPRSPGLRGFHRARRSRRPRGRLCLRPAARRAVHGRPRPRRSRGTKSPSPSVRSRRSTVPSSASASPPSRAAARRPSRNFRRSSTRCAH